LTASERVRLLSSEFTISTNSEEVRDLLRQMTPRAAQSAAIFHRQVFIAERIGNEFRIGTGADDGDFELTAYYAADNLLKRMYRAALAGLPEHVRLRAAIGRHADRTFLIVGPKRSGKTTLGLSLLFEGIEISGDDLVLLHDGEATAFPWRFVVNEASVPFLPRLKESLVGTPRQGSADRDWHFAVDPIDFGMPWEISPAAISAIFYLEPNYGARTTIIEAGKLDMAKRVLPQSSAPISGRKGWVSEITSGVDRAQTFIVRLGDLASATIAIKRLLG
jgi:hypothetical protein